MAIPVAAGSHQLQIVRPQQLRDAQVLIASVRANRAVVLCTADMPDPQAQRLIDFACGGMEAIGAQVHRIDAETFLFAPLQVCVEHLQEHAQELGRSVA